MKVANKQLIKLRALQ